MTPKVGATFPPTNASHPSAEPLDFNAATNASSGQTQRIYGLVHFTDIVWPMNLWCGQGCQSQTPPYLDIQEVMHLVFQAPNTLAPKTCFILLWQPAVSMSGNKGKESTPPFFKSSGFEKSVFGIKKKGSR